MYTACLPKGFSIFRSLGPTVIYIAYNIAAINTNYIRVTNRQPCSCSLLASLASVALFTTLHLSNAAITGPAL